MYCALVVTWVAVLGAENARQSGFGGECACDFMDLNEEENNTFMTVQ